MTTPSQINTAPVTQLDTDTSELGRVQNDLIALFTECARRHQEIDAEYVPRINALLERAQTVFNRIHGLADTSRSRIVTKGKSAKRQSGTHGWRSVVRADFGELTDEQFIETILASGDQRLKRRFLRRVNRWEIVRTALTSTVNRDVVSDALTNLFGGAFSLTQTEEYTCAPAGGFKMSTSHRLWPSLDGVPLPETWETILRGPDA